MQLPHLACDRLAAFAQQMQLSLKRGAFQFAYQSFRPLQTPFRSGFFRHAILLTLCRFNGFLIRATWGTLRPM